MEQITVVIREQKTVYFNFDCPKNVDMNSKHETKFITKTSKYLGENKIKNKIEQLLSNYKHGNNIH